MKTLIENKLFIKINKKYKINFMKNFGSQL
jgi:hypothetical protein